MFLYIYCLFVVFIDVSVVVVEVVSKAPPSIKLFELLLLIVSLWCSVSPLLALAVPDSESLLMPILAAVSNWKMFKKKQCVYFFD
jgi:hypothetical protein